MRILELLFIITTSILCSADPRGEELNFTVIIFIGLSILVLHLVTQQSRWQLIPCFISYFLITNEFLLFYSEEFDLSSPAHYIADALVFLTLASCVIFPIPELPTPTGPWRVGTITHHWVLHQTLKKGYLTEETFEHDHTLFMKIWYPCDVQGEVKTAPYWVLPGNDIYKEPLTNHTGFGSFDEKIPFLTSHIWSLTKCHSVYGVPLSGQLKKYPILYYSHGQGSLPEKNTAIAEDLASHGYIVCSAYHRDFEKQWPGPVHRRQSEVRDVLDMLEIMNIDKDTPIGPNVVPGNGMSPSREGIKGMFFGKLDLDKGVGVWGHSFGGMASIFLASDNVITDAVDSCAYVSCCVGMDPWMEPILLNNMPKLNKPLMLICSDLWLSKDRDLEKLDKLPNKSSSVTYRVTMENTCHYNFGDSSFLLTSIFGSILIPKRFLIESQEGKFPLFGPADPVKVHQEVKLIIKSFFATHLQTPDKAKGEVVEIKSKPNVYKVSIIDHQD